MGKLVGAGIAPCRVQDATGGGVQLDHATPQAISGLQFHVFIRNRSRGANVAYPKLLHGGKGGRCSGAAVQQCSGAAVDR